MTSRARRRISGESPHFRYFLLTVFSVNGSDMDTIRPVRSITCIGENVAFGRARCIACIIKVMDRIIDGVDDTGY